MIFLKIRLGMGQVAGQEHQGTLHVAKVEVAGASLKRGGGGLRDKPGGD